MAKSWGIDLAAGQRWCHATGASTDRSSISRFPLTPPTSPRPSEIVPGVGLIARCELAVDGRCQQERYRHAHAAKAGVSVYPYACRVGVCRARAVVSVHVSLHRDYGDRRYCTDRARPRP
jgi:hypothetical protein